MNKETVLKLLPLINSSPANTHRTGWVVARCPFAPVKHEGGTDKNPSFGIKLGKSSIYNCFSCNSGGNVEDLPLDLKIAFGKGKTPGYDLVSALQLIADNEEPLGIDIPDYDQEEVAEVTPFPEQWLESYKCFSCFLAARNYLAGRNVPEWVSAELDLRYDSTNKRVCFPIRDWAGKLVGFHGRNLDPQAPFPYYAYRHKGVWNKLPWLGEGWVQRDQLVVLVESVFDLARVYSTYQNVMCGLSAGLSDKKIERLRCLSEVVTLYDYGTGGNTARDKLEKILGGRIISQLIPTEDEGDPGNMSDDRIKAMLEPFLSLDALKVP